MDVVFMEVLIRSASRYVFRSGMWADKQRDDCRSVGAPDSVYVTCDAFGDVRDGWRARVPRCVHVPEPPPPRSPVARSSHTNHSHKGVEWAYARATSNKNIIVVREPNTQHVRTANITDLGNFAQRESHKRVHSSHTSISKINELIKIERGLCEENKGPYQIEWEKFEECKGPKQSECGKFEIKSSQNKSDVVFLLDFPKDCPATSAKIVVSTMSNNVTKKLWNYALNKPCEHFVMGPVLVDSFNLTKNCKVNKQSEICGVNLVGNGARCHLSRWRPPR
ncbi:unnamed protein product [Spodoptera exigua]|nr:unnamed protein product [Spodoptera exigua]